MNDSDRIRERFLRAGLPTRVGGIAMNLSRIKSLAANDTNRAVVESVIEESKWFIE